MGLDKTPDLAQIEERARELWASTGIYEFDPGAPGEIFSVDTPPPYVSAAHLHVGHAMSYSQAEFIVRYQRMRGRNVFYPMGFDDNGLPTERYVEQTYNVDKARTTRSEFRALCLEETSRIGVGYERFWRKLGLSVDWRLQYSTIDDHCRRTSQLSFLDLHRRQGACTAPRSRCSGIRRCRRRSRRRTSKRSPATRRFTTSPSGRPTAATS